MITVRALGPVDVSIDGRAAPPELRWRKNLALLVYLARSPRRTRTREHLMGLLWGDKPESQARHSLREAIRALRAAGGESLLETEGDQVRLADGAVDLDAGGFVALADAKDWDGAQSLALGEFLEGFSVPDAPGFEDWITAERLVFRRRTLEVLTRRADILQRSGQLAESAAMARRALTLDPCSAGAVQALMRALALLGERAEALAAYDAFAAHLEEVVGAAPDPATAQLADQVRKGRSWQARRESQPRGAESRRAPLAGRDRDLALLLDAWRDACAGRATLVMLEGAAGAGRTRLAEEVAERARLDGAAVAMVRGVPADRTAAWSGVYGLAAGGLIAASGIGGAAAPALARFAQHADDWADRFPDARRVAAPLEPGIALTAVLRAAAVEQPLVLILDDAHWLDGESLALLLPLARDLAGSPVMIVVTSLSQPPREELELLRSRVGHDVPGRHLTVEPLGADALLDLAAWAMPGWSRPDAERLARRIAADSAGLPLLAVELLHAVALGLDLHGTARTWPEPQRTLDQTLPGELPDTVVAAVRIGFRRLGKDAQKAVAAVAVLGDRAELGRLAEATGLGEDALSRGLDEAEWERWIAADGRGYVFVARLAGEIVARDLVTAGQRRRIRERA